MGSRAPTCRWRTGLATRSRVSIERSVVDDVIAHRSPMWCAAGVGVRVPGDVLVHLRRARDHIDSNFASDVDLDEVARIARLSKFHFLRLFSATYGVTPGAYLTNRRVERAQDLLRTTNLTVTEVCMSVGYSSLGSFTTRFRRIVGETPGAFQRRWALDGAPRIPGCFVFMWGLAERQSDDVAIEEKPPVARSS